MQRDNDLPRLTGIHVLVVNDGADQARYVAAVLRCCGALVTVASPEAALRFLRSVTPQVLVIDESPPDSGRESLIMTVRSLFPERAGVIPALVLREHCDDRTRAAALAAGYQEDLRKPFDAFEFAWLVARLGGM